LISPGIKDAGSQTIIDRAFSETNDLEMSAFSGFPTLRNIFPLNQSNYGTVVLPNNQKVIGFIDSALPREFEGWEQSQHNWSSGYSRVNNQNNLANIFIQPA